MQIEGFSAISRANGWEIAILGFFIVYAGLALLGLAISGLHHCLDFFEERGKRFREKRRDVALETLSAGKPVSDLVREKGMRESYHAYALLSEMLPSPLSLPALLDAASQRGIRRCYAVLADLLKAGVLKADGKGYYTWDHACFDALMGGEKD